MRANDTGTALRQASVIFVATLALGASAAAATGEEGLYLAGAVLAGATVIAIAARRPRLAVVSGALFLGVVMTATIAGPRPSHDLLLFVGSSIALLVVGPRLGERAYDSMTLAVQGSSTLDAQAQKELRRARRAERSLTVGSIRLEGRPRRQQLAEVAARLQATVRETDLLCYAGRGRFYVLFVETVPPDVASTAWARLHSALDPAVGDRLVVGFAGFPEDNPTWEGLKALAQARERPEAMVELAPGRGRGAVLSRSEGAA